MERIMLYLERNCDYASNANQDNIYHEELVFETLDALTKLNVNVPNDEDIFFNVLLGKKSQPVGVLDAAFIAGSEIYIVKSKIVTPSKDASACLLGGRRVAMWGAGRRKLNVACYRANAFLAPLCDKEPFIIASYSSRRLSTARLYRLHGTEDGHVTNHDYPYYHPTSIDELTSTSVRISDL